MPARRSEPELAQRALSLSTALVAAIRQHEREIAVEASGVSSTADKPKVNDKLRVRRILHEARLILRDPHPHVRVLPSEEDIGFWNLIIRGPSGTPYAGGIWLAYIRFPAQFPDRPPHVRFVDPIRHCNIGAGCTFSALS